MPRHGKRLRIASGIYRDGRGGPYEIRVTIGGQTYYTRCPADATPEELRAARAHLSAHGHTVTPRTQRGTLRAAVPSYLRLVAHLASADDREDHCRAWTTLLGNRPRHRINANDVLTARAHWLALGKSPKTINHYCDTLRNLYHRLDGPRATTPCDDVPHLPVMRTPIQRVSESLMLKVDAELQRREAAGILRSSKTRARFRVLVSTGKRPIEVMRAERLDVDLDHRVWIPRDAKGGHTIGVYLNDDMLAAWKLFVEADAWGPYNHGAFARSLRSAGWPDDVRVYQARHNTWMAASERGVDLADISAGAGHKDLRMTRNAYAPVLNSRMQQMGERLDGRFAAWPVVNDLGTERKRDSSRRKSSSGKRR